MHAAFVLVRVFRLPASDHRCWQSSLIDSELEALVIARASAASLRRQQARDAAAPLAIRSGDPTGKSGRVSRRPLSEGDADPCPICYEDLTPEEDETGRLDWCSLGCGKSLHRHCFAMWAEHQSSINKSLTCPFCRGSWASGPLAPPPPPPARVAIRVAVHRSATCRSCRVTPITGTRYRCLVCPEKLELCPDCYDSRMHPHHPFAARERPGAPWALGETRPDEPLGTPHTSAHVGSGGSRDAEEELAGALAALQHREIGPEVKTYY
jgi:hypothetical protein